MFFDSTVHTATDTAPATGKPLRTDTRAILEINFDAECAEWWDAWFALATGTRAAMPPEMRKLDDQDHTPPVTLERLERLLAWCESLPGWRASSKARALRALKVTPVQECGNCEAGTCDARDFAYTPGAYHGPRYFPCLECKGRGWVRA